MVEGQSRKDIIRKELISNAYKALEETGCGGEFMTDVASIGH